MEILNIKKNNYFVGRAATGIYLILLSNGFQGKKVLVPANICYAAIYPIIYAGAIPIFCDVDSKTGNMTYELITGKIAEVDAIIAPHMYGNPIQDIQAIADMCKDYNVLLIEDCASAMGATIDGTLCGSWGDYAIYSTGYSKTIDIGGGGIVASNNELESIAALYDQLPDVLDCFEEEEAFFSKLYRLIRNSEASHIHKAIWTGLKEEMQFLFVYKDHRFDEELAHIEDALPDIISRRKDDYLLYKSIIRNKEYVYEFYEGSVPWRFCMMIPYEKHRLIIDELLNHGVPVSDWYPVVTPVFGETSTDYPSALMMENQIINFPLLIDHAEIIRICDVINKVLDMENVR